MRNEINLTDDQILAAFAEAGHEYIDMLFLTRETLDNFKSSAATWAECKSVDDEEYAGFTAVEFGEVQVAPGQERHALTVIDFGAVRASYKRPPRAMKPAS